MENLLSGRKVFIMYIILHFYYRFLYVCVLLSHLIQLLILFGPFLISCGVVLEMKGTVLVLVVRVHL